jgi:hypothetical protein
MQILEKGFVFSTLPVKTKMEKQTDKELEDEIKEISEFDIKCLEDEIESKMAKNIYRLMKKNKESFKVHRARHIFAQSIFDDTELGYALIDYMLFKENRKGRKQARQGMVKIEDVNDVVIKWHSLDNPKWDVRSKGEHYYSMDNAVQDLLQSLKKLGEKNADI